MAVDGVRNAGHTGERGLGPGDQPPQLRIERGQPMLAAEPVPAGPGGQPGHTRESIQRSS